MLRILVTYLKVNVRAKSAVFWTLAFPIILITLLHVAFGGFQEEEVFQNMQAAVVGKGEDQEEEDAFWNYLTSFGEETLTVTSMEEKEAKELLADHKIKGIFYSGSTQSLTVGETDISASILEQILNSYRKNRSQILEISQEHPEGLQAALDQMAAYDTAVEQVNFNGKEANPLQNYFYAALGMTCLYGSFLSLYASVVVQANTSALGARTASGCMKRWKGILASLLTGWILNFAEILIVLFYMQAVLKEIQTEGQLGRILLLVFVGSFCSSCLGMLVGTAGAASEKAKNGFLVSISLVLSFMADLMTVGVKHFLEEHLAVINRLNPAALISDALYSTLIYENPAKYTRSVLWLALLGLVMLVIAVVSMRRMRYDSI